jgi:hypothetical protein
MYRKSLLLLMALTIAALFMVGCSDDDDNNPTGGNTTTPPEMPAIVEAFDQLTENQVGTNLAQSSVPYGYGTMASTYVTLATVASGWLVPPPSASKEILPSLALSDTVTYTWSEGALTISMLWIETATEYVWKATIDGTYERVVYDNFLIIEARQDLAGTIGWMEMYDPGGVGALFRWDWAVSGGVFTMTMTGTVGDDTLAVEIIINADGSGYVEYESGLTYWKITWNAAGTDGEWYTTTEFGTWTSG